MSHIDRHGMPIGRRQGVATLALGHDTLAVPSFERWLARGWRTLQAALARSVDAIVTWRERARMRRQLLMLDDHLLRDIGISRLQARREAEKPFWRG